MSSPRSLTFDIGRLPQVETWGRQEPGATSDAWNGSPLPRCSTP